MTENEVGGDLIHPDDIGIKIPEDDGPWRLANSEGDQPVMLLRFGRRTDMNSREKQVAARHVGILSKTRREELIMEQEKAMQKELDKKKPVDKRNPWGGVAESWAIETRGRMGTDFEDFLDAYSRDRERRNRKDWDDPGDEDVSPKKTGGVRDRLGWSGSRRDQEEGGDQDEDMEWATRMKKPRMGMVADIVEKGSARSRLGDGDQALRRKTARRSGDLDDPEAFQDLRQKVSGSERVIKTAGRRLNDRFAGGRLEGRLGLSGSSSSGLRSRLGNQDMDDDDGRDSLERDMGEDLQGMELVNNMVIRVNRDKDVEKDVRDRISRNRDRPAPKSAEEREREIRQRLKEIKREKDLIDEKKRQDRARDRDGDRAMERARDRHYDREMERRQERDRDDRRESRRLDRGHAVDSRDERLSRTERHKPKKRVQESSDDDSGSDSDSSESDDSDSDSSGESSDSEEESDSSDSDSSSSSDSEDERQRRKKDKRSLQKQSSRSHGSSSKHSDRKSEKKSSKSSSKKETDEELKKAAELRDQLRNYLKKAKEAKEKKKK